MVGSSLLVWDDMLTGELITTVWPRELWAGVWIWYVCISPPAPAEETVL